MGLACHIEVAVWANGDDRRRVGVGPAQIGGVVQAGRLPAAGRARRVDEFVLLQGSAAIGAGGRDPFDGLTLEAALALGRLSEREAVALGGDRMTIYGSA